MRLWLLLRSRARPVALTALVALATGSAGVVATEAPQAPNPLPRGLFDPDTKAVDPASDGEEDSAPLPPAPSPGPVAPAPTATATATTTTTERIRLIYAPGPWASVCPAADDVPRMVGQHLAADPFGEPATRVALIALAGTGAIPQRARVELLDLDLQPIGSRVVDASDGCAELVATAAFQLAIALDPLAGTGPGLGPAADPADPGPAPAGPAGPGPPPAPVGTVGSAPDDSAAAVAGTTPTVPAEADPFAPELFLTGGAHVAALIAPEGAMAGLSVGAGGRWAAVSVRGEGRIDLSGGDQGTTSIPVLLTVLPCAHLPLVDLGATDGVIEATGCLTLTAGAVPSFGVYTGFGIYAGSGGRLGLDWHMPGEITLRSFAQVEAAGLRPLLVNLSSGNIYQSPPFNVMLGLGMDLPDF